MGRQSSRIVGASAGGQLTQSTSSLTPRDELDEVGVERDTSLGVKGGRGGGANKVGGDDLVLGVVKDTLKLVLGRSLHGSLDLLVGGGLLDTGDKVDDGNVGGWDSESHTGELAVEGWDDLTDGLLVKEWEVDQRRAPYHDCHLRWLSPWRHRWRKG